MIIESVSDIQCNPIFYSLKNFFCGLNVFLKLEGLNLAGSIKFVTAKYMIDQLERSGRLDKTKKLIESSSGNLGIALSIVCKARGYSFTCVVDPNILPQNEKLMRAYGARVIKVTNPDKNGGYLGSRIKMIQTLLSSDYDLIWVNQYSNPDNPYAHYEKTAKEILKQFPKLDYLFIGAGTTGTLMGCARYFKTHSPSTRIIGIDVKGSITFGGIALPRYVPGLGTSRKPEIADRGLIDELLVVEEQEGIQFCHSLLEKEGMLIGGSTGMVLAGIEKYQDRLDKSSISTAISPDFGERYLDTIYNFEWLSQKNFHLKQTSYDLSTRGLLFEEQSN